VSESGSSEPERARAPRQKLEGGQLLSEITNRIVSFMREHHWRGLSKMMKDRYTTMIEELTGRKVLAFLSQAHVEPDLTIEMFLMDAPLPTAGALELVDLNDS
jgi:hypothetical protein